MTLEPTFTRPWTVGELAQACNVSESYVRKCIKAGTLAVRRVGRVVRIASPDALRFAADLGAVVAVTHQAHSAHQAHPVTQPFDPKR